MIFQMPHYPCTFEIPDEWLSGTGMSGFEPTTAGYRSTATAVLIPLTAIEPVPRFSTHPKDWHGFERTRLIHLLKRFVAGEEVDPVPLFLLPVFEFANSPYRYRVLDGFHRFYGSIAAGFSHLSAVI
jgi:hypothetical protein